MKINKLLVASLLASVTAITAARADVTIVFTGSTAFRSVANQTILTALSNETVRYNGSSLNSANQAIFQGTIDSQPGLGVVTVKTAWSGSGTGVVTLKNDSNLTVLADSELLIGTAGTTAATSSTPATTTAKGTFSFSDVQQGNTSAPATPSLVGTPVGVVPFRLLASESAPATFTNITDQQIAALYSSGFAPLSYFTGDPADAGVTVYPIGRDSGSGTRITVLAESGYGIKNDVFQYQPTVVSGVITDINEPSGGNGGYSSGSGLVGPLGSTSTDFIVVGYVGVSDAANAIAAGAKSLTYNGGTYSTANIKNGSYTLWGYEQMYNKVAALSTDEATFRTVLLNTIPTAINALGETAGVPISEMLVDRNGDGGPVFSNQ